MTGSVSNRGVERTKCSQSLEATYSDHDILSGAKFPGI